MSLSQTQRSQQSASSEPAYRKFQRACLALCIVIAPVVLGLGLGIAPGGGLNIPSDPGILVAQFRAASSLQVQLFLYLNALVPYFFPLSFIGLGLVALRRSPWLATIGMIFGLAGSLPYGMFLGPMSEFATVAQLGDSAAFNALLHDASARGALLFLAGSWVIGHLIGYVLIGVALIHSRAIPRWAAILIIVGIPFQMAGYGANLPVLQDICFALIFIGSIPAALVMLKRPDEEWSVRAAEQPVSAS
jgi:hypothetical protein